MTTQPEALRLFTHQMLNHEGKPDGVHIGCDDLEVCKQSHVDGETSPVIHEWVDAAELRRLHAQRDALLEALKSTGLFLHHCWCDVQMNDYSFEKLNQQMAVVDAAIKAVEGEKK